MEWGVSLLCEKCPAWGHAPSRSLINSWVDGAWILWPGCWVENGQVGRKHTSRCQERPERGLGQVVAAGEEGDREDLPGNG